MIDHGTIYAIAAFFSFWCLFKLCFLANFRFLKNLGSQPFMLMCLLVEGFLIPPLWFLRVWL